MATIYQEVIGKLQTPRTVTLVSELLHAMDEYLRNVKNWHASRDIRLAMECDYETKFSSVDLTHQEEVYIASRLFEHLKANDLYLAYPLELLRGTVTHTIRVTVCTRSNYVN